MESRQHQQQQRGGGGGPPSRGGRGAAKEGGARAGGSGQGGATSSQRTASGGSAGSTNSSSTRGGRSASEGKGEGGGRGAPRPRRGGEAGSARGRPAPSAQQQGQQQQHRRPAGGAPPRTDPKAAGSSRAPAHPSSSAAAAAAPSSSTTTTTTITGAGTSSSSTGGAQPRASLSSKPAPWAIKSAPSSANTADVAVPDAAPASSSSSSSSAASPASPSFAVSSPSSSPAATTAVTAGAPVLSPENDEVVGLCLGSFAATELPTARAPIVAQEVTSPASLPKSSSVVAVVLPASTEGASASNGAATTPVIENGAATTVVVATDTGIPADGSDLPSENGATVTAPAEEVSAARKPVVNAWGKGLPASLQKQVEINKQQAARQQRQQPSSTPAMLALRHFDEVRILWQASFTDAALRGLHNEGNTCFLNATVQCLLACPPFIGFLRNLRGKRFPCAAPSLYEIVRFAEAFEMERKSSATVVPMAAKAHFGVVIKKLAGTPGRQEDAHEFLSLLLDTLHEELQAGSRALLSNGDDASHKSSSRSTDEWNEVGRKNKTSKLRTAEFEDTAITRIFGCKLRSCLRSRGAKQSITQELFHSLPLDVSSPQIQSLNDALLGFMSAESLDWDVRASKQYKFERMPGVLIVQFKRFAFSAAGGGKITKNIDFSERLVIPTGLLGPHVGTTEKERSYDLFGLVEHHGVTLHNGHYTAAIKRNDQWFIVDDTTITPTTLPTVLRRQAYLLFYLRTHTPGASSRAGGKKEPS